MKPDQRHTVLPAALQARFKKYWEQCRVIYISAPCGLGKTTSAQALLAGHTVCACSAAAPGFAAKLAEKPCEAVLIDDFQAVKDPADQQAVCALLNGSPGKHFVFLGRGVLPGWLMPYQLTGLLAVIGVEDLLFDRAAMQELAAKYKVALTDAELAALLEETKGYPLLLGLLYRHMAEGEPYGQRLLQTGARELFHYIEEAVYRRFSPEMRRLLVSLAPFDGFDSELAKLVSGDPHVNDLLNQILHETTMLDPGGVDGYRFWPVFRRFLLWELEQDCTPEEQAGVYRRAGLYYELHEDYARALDCYAKSGDQNKISQLLVKNAEQHPGAAHYYEMERYYYALPKEDVLRSPTLMCGMSMLTSLCLDYEASEQWYAELKNYAARLQKTDADYREAQSRLLYLDVALPQRGSKNLAELIRMVFQAMADKKLKLPAFSVTSCLPSIMNGGKDFCEWSKRDDLLYATMKRPLETVLGKDGVGLADCAICESKFEKGEDVSARLLALMSRMTEIQRKGTPDIEFAVVGLLVRQQVAQGKALSALETLDNLRDSFADAGRARFLPNMDAMRCRIWLRLGETAQAARWLRENAPGSIPHFRALWRYQYMTKAMCLIANGAPDEALLSIAPLLPYCEQCGRVMDGLHLRLLMAICHYRLHERSAWRAELKSALDAAAEYRFIAPVAQYGAAVLPLLAECGWGGDAGYFGRLVAAAREQAVHYPDFLRPAAVLAEPLSPAELQVLRLMCHNRGNQEIADILGVKLSTIKSQVSSILHKLGVKRRSEAKEAAEALHLADPGGSG